MSIKVHYSTSKRGRINVHVVDGGNTFTHRCPPDSLLSEIQSTIKMISPIEKPHEVEHILRFAGLLRT